MAIADSSSLGQSTERRTLGRYYTPPAVARYLVQGCFERHRDAGTSSPIRILDPACGDGVLLLQAFDTLLDWRGGSLDTFANAPGGGERSAIERLEIVRSHLFGVDVDGTAVARLQDELVRRIAPTAELADEARRVVAENVRCGDALTGPDFHADDHQTSPESPSTPVPLDWRQAFPQVAANGGFDVVVGNPPYRRELSARSDFARIADSSLGRRWRQARMDLWYYFLHRSLDVLKAGGRLAFIVNSYWTASTGAEKLIARLGQETTLEEIVLLGERPVFPDVVGRHLIFRLHKGQTDRDCTIIDASNSQMALDSILALLEADNRAVCGSTAGRTARRTAPSGVCMFSVPQKQLFQQRRLVLSRPDPLLDGLSGLATLGERYDVRQGMAENPGRISSRNTREFGNDFETGRGVFVLTETEAASLNLSQSERQHLRPYYETSELGRYSVPASPSHYVLYLTRNTVPNLDDCPGLRRHLGRFRPLLERRREVRSGSIGWWHLHWPRDERIFTEPRILSVQMGREPQFAFAGHPTYVGFSVNVVLARDEAAADLMVVTGLLNSSLARRWFSRFAKQRGVHLEINGGLLRQFPLPARNRPIELQLSQLVAQRMQADEADRRSEGSVNIARIEQKIDRLVFELYGLEYERMSNDRR